MTVMLLRFLLLLSCVLFAASAEAAIVATWRGNNPNPFSLKTPYIGGADFDLNGDGTVDFRFANGPFTASIKSYNSNRVIADLQGQSTHATQIEAGGILGEDTSSLPGIRVIPGEHLPDPSLSTGTDLTILNELTTFIGVELHLEDGIHYGWISYMGFRSPDTNTHYPYPGGFIDVWAWETEPGKPIAAGQVPEPGTASLLPAAALGLLRRRRAHRRESSLPRMSSRFFAPIFCLSLIYSAGAAVVVTYRGNNPNPFPLTSPYLGESDFDLNGDGTADLRFGNSPSAAVIKSYFHSTNSYTLIRGVEEIWPVRSNYAAAIPAGAIIDRDSYWEGVGNFNTEPSSLSTGGSLARLNNVTSYIGVELSLEDGVHYGWISYVGFGSPDTSASYPYPGGFIDVWAWETEPGKPIAAGQVPEPGAASLLPAAALGLLRRRRAHCG